MHRLFIAIDLPETVKNSIKSICGGIPDARWVDVQQLHLTLRFIGEVDDRMFDSIKNSLAEITETRFSLTLRGVGSFPPKRPPRVLWVGIENSETLIRLAGEVEEVLVRKNGLEPEERKFSPHITIARFRLRFEMWGNGRPGSSASGVRTGKTERTKSESSSFRARGGAAEISE